MRFSWDPKKNATTLRERGFDFAFASQIFDGPTLEREDTRQDYGERRILAIGVVLGIELTVGYTDRVHSKQDLERRIFSARRSDRRERKAYHKALQAR